MRLIDADKLKENFNNADACGLNLELDRYAIKCIDNAPTIDPVRCGMATEIIESLLNLIQEICADQRERHKDDSVCGLCEYDGPSWMECPGYEREDCFLLKRDVRAKYYIPYDPVQHGYWKETDDPMFKACSVCGYLEWRGLWNNYCPECGARMDGGNGVSND